MKLKIKRFREGAILPEYQTRLSAGFDIHAAIGADLTLRPMERYAVPAGFGLEIPEEYELQIRARSGLATKNGITMANGVGTIDADYRGEISIALVNLGEEDFVITPGMRIAQGVLARFETAEWDEVEELGETERKGGFGSTGV